jgi:hypothetical protein
LHTLAAVARRAAIASVAAIMLVPLTTTESTAATCPANNFCLWEEGPSSPMARFVNGTDDTGRAGLPYGGETMQNRTQHDWCVWSKRDYRGTKKVVHPGEWVSFGGFTVFSLLPETTWTCIT